MLLCLHLSICFFLFLLSSFFFFFFFSSGTRRASQPPRGFSVSPPTQLVFLFLLLLLLVSFCIITNNKSEPLSSSSVGAPQSGGLVWFLWITKVLLGCSVRRRERHISVFVICYYFGGYDLLSCCQVKADWLWTPTQREGEELDEVLLFRSGQKALKVEPQKASLPALRRLIKTSLVRKTISGFNTGSKSLSCFALLEPRQVNGHIRCCYTSTPDAPAAAATLGFTWAVNCCSRSAQTSDQFDMNCFLSLSEKLTQFKKVFHKLGDDVLRTQRAASPSVLLRGYFGQRVPGGSVV